MRELISNPDVVPTQKEILKIVLRLSLKKSVEISAGSGKIAYQAAHLSSKGIPTILLSGESVEESLDALVRLGLAEFNRDAGLVSMHPLIQTIIIEDLSIDQQTSALGDLITKFGKELEQFRENKTSTWIVAGRVYPHLKPLCIYGHLP